MSSIIRAALYVFGGAAWTFLSLHIQQHFFLPDDLTARQLLRIEKAKWVLTLIGAIGGLIVFWSR